MARTPRPRVAGVERLLHIPRRGNRVPRDVAALSHSNELLLLIGLVVEDQTVPYAPPLGRRLRGASGEQERDEQREEQQPSTLHTTSKSQRQPPVACPNPGCQGIAGERPPRRRSPGCQCPLDSGP